MSSVRLRALKGATLTVAALAGAAVSPLLAQERLLLGLGIIATLVGAGLMFATPARDHGRVVAGGHLVLHLAPVGLLMVAYPVAATRITSGLDRVPLLTILLAASASVPWLSQAGCLPLYRVIGDMLPVLDRASHDDVAHRLVQAWPGVLLRTAPVVLLFAIPLELVLRWPLRVWLVLVLLLLLHLVFAQSVVLANVTQRRLRWAVSWLAYAAALLAAPTWWPLPAILATAVHVVPLLRADRAARTAAGAVATARRSRRTAVPLAQTWQDVVRGFLMGSVLWADKLLLFVMTAGLFQVDVVYLAMLPVVLAYNFYFVRVAPAFDRDVIRLRHALEREPLAGLASTTRELVHGTVAGLSRTAGIAGVLTLGIVGIISVLRPHLASLAAAVALASWVFMAVTLLSYKLDYVGHRTSAMVVGAVHLVLVVLAFATLSATSAYVALAIGDCALLVVTAYLVQRAWSSPAYTLFWRHATSW
ncbi:hypothetical protein [Arsenicicoccus dermatophilus]|uniref:hypothetical protein n=1 Tax=Arsenicicoccus dermatophilus TaxID=1076331 RepID=UPI003917555E